MKTSACDLLAVLEGLRLTNVPSESDLHTAIAEAFASEGITFEHEARIAPRRRADFLVDGVVIEVKKSKPLKNQLIKQISGYLECEGVNELIVVTQKRVNLPGSLHGKPVYQLALDRLWGIALP